MEARTSGSVVEARTDTGSDVELGRRARTMARTFGRSDARQLGRIGKLRVKIPENEINQ
jgi:hypothetical protein